MTLMTRIADKTGILGSTNASIIEWPMSPLRLSFLTLIAMLSFAGKSVLCRLALRQTAIDAASFTTLRLLSGALTLTLLVYCQQRAVTRAKEGTS